MVISSAWRRHGLLAGCLVGLFLALSGEARASGAQKDCKARGHVSLVLLFDRSRSMDSVAEKTFGAIKSAIESPQWGKLKCEIYYVARGFYAPRPTVARRPEVRPPPQRLEWFPACDGGTNCTTAEVFAHFNEKTDGGQESFLASVSAATADAGSSDKLNRDNTPLAEAIRWASQHPRPEAAATGISILLLATDGIPEHGVLVRSQVKRDLSCLPHGELVTDMRNAWLEARRRFSDIFVIYDPALTQDARSGLYPGSDLDFLKSKSTGAELLSLPPPASVPRGCDGGVNLLPLNDINPEELRAEIRSFSAGNPDPVKELAAQFVKLLKETCDRSLNCCDPETCDGQDNDCDGEVDELPCPSCESEPAGFPEVVAVGRRGRYRCSGVIVSPHAVLTARHCLPADTVLAGESIHAAAELRRAVRVHLPVEPTADVAVLELEAPLKVRPPPRRHLVDIAPPTSVLSHVGFGASTPQGELGFGFKHALALDGRGWGCDGEHALETGCDPSFEMFVPGSPGRDTCQGDSGGGLFELVPPDPACVEPVTRAWLPRRRLIGVTSRTTSRATVACGQGGIYTRIDQIAPWLDSLVEDIHQRRAVQGGDSE